MSDADFKSLPTGRDALVDAPAGFGSEGVGVRWHGLSVADYIQYLAHSGYVNSVSYRWLDVADDGTATFLIQADPGSDTVAIFDFIATNNWGVDIYENPTVTDEGTPVDSHNLDRGNLDVVDSEFYHTPSTSGGLNIYSALVGEKSGEGKDKVGYWQLKANTYYLIVLTNKSGSVASCALSILVFAEDLSMHATSTSSSSTSSSSSSSSSHSTSSSSSSSISESTSSSSLSESTSSSSISESTSISSSSSSISESTSSSSISESTSSSSSESTSSSSISESTSSSSSESTSSSSVSSSSSSISVTFTGL